MTFVCNQLDMYAGLPRDGVEAGVTRALHH